MQYHNGIYCISARELIDGGIMTLGSYEKAAQRKRIEVVKRGGGAKGSGALVAVDSLSTEQKIQVEARFGGKAAHIAAWVRSNYTEDQEAMAFFNNPQKTGISNLSIAKRRNMLSMPRF